MGLLNLITVEPAMFLQQTGDTLTYVIYQNLFIDKICRTQLGYSSLLCEQYEKLSNDLTPEQEHFKPMMNEIQTASSQFLLYNSLVENSLPVFLVLFLGVWSDQKRRRKPPLLLCLIGKMLRSFGLIVNSYFMDWSPVLLLFTAALPHALGGANAVFHMSSFSYIADSSVPRSRTWRLGVAEAFWQLGSPIGLFLGAYLFQKGGYLCVFATSFLCHLISVLYTAFILPEVPQPKPTKILVLSKYGSYGTYTEGQGSSALAKRIRFYSENEKVATGGTTYNEEEEEDEEYNESDLLTEDEEEDDSECRSTDVEASQSQTNNINNNNNNIKTDSLDFGQGQNQSLSPQSVQSDSPFYNEKQSLLNGRAAAEGLLVPGSSSQGIGNAKISGSGRRGSSSRSNNINPATGGETPPNSVYDFIIGSIRSIIRPRANHTRKCLLSLGAIMLLYGIAMYGEANLKYLFTRSKFQWREQQFSLWTIFDSVVVVLGLTVTMPIFSKLLKLSDPLAGAIAAAARAASRLCFSLAPTSKYLFYGSLMDIPGVIGPLSARSLASKCVLRDERGRVFAFLGCIEAVVPLVAVPIYSLIYSYTLTFAPSAIYYLSTSIYVSIFIIFGILFVALKMKVVQFTGTDLSTLFEKSRTVSGGHYASNIYRRSSLS